VAQIKGIAYHAAMGKRKPGEVDAMVSEIGKQVEHWLTCDVPRQHGKRRGKHER
jgi:hypothetical protein